MSYLYLPLNSTLFLKSELQLFLDMGNSFLLAYKVELYLKSQDLPSPDRLKVHLLYHQLEGQVKVVTLFSFTVNLGYLVVLDA